MRMLFFIIAIPLMFFAGELALSDETASVTILDPNFNNRADEFKKVGYQITDNSVVKSETPEVSKIERLYSDSGLSSSTQKWDQLDKDILFAVCKDRKIEEVQKLYPKLSKVELKKFHKLVRATASESAEK